MAFKLFNLLRARYFNSQSDAAVEVSLSTDANPRLAVDAGGRLSWGDGTSSVDTNLYRDAANTLKTDDTFKAPAVYIDGIEVDTTGAATGNTFVYNGTKFEPGTAPVNLPGGEPIGHTDKSQSTISFDEGNRRFSISPVSGSFEVWCKGVKYTKTGTETVDIPDTSGLYYIYYSNTGVLSYRTSFFDWENDTPTAYIYWNEVDNKAYFFADERHGIVLDWQTHEYLHRTRGAALANGFGANNYILAGDGSLDSHAQLDIANGTFFDEDLQVDITHPQQIHGNRLFRVLQRYPFFIDLIIIGKMTPRRSSR
jgi:hypothetical protein